jgi:hypothetical protein
LRADTRHKPSWSVALLNRPHRATSTSARSNDAAADLGQWAALNALGLRKIVKKFDKASCRRRAAGDPRWATPQSSASPGVDWVQEVALARLSFMQSALRVEVFALATRAQRARLVSSPLVETAAAAATTVESAPDAGCLAGGAAAPEDSVQEPTGEATALPPLRTLRFPSEKNAGESPDAGPSVGAGHDGRADTDSCDGGDENDGADKVLDLAENAGNRFADSLSCASYVASLTSCQLCLEVMVAPVGVVGCGHPVCRPCFDRMRQVDAADAAAAARAAITGAAGVDAAAAVAAASRASSLVSRCPTCRALAGGHVELVQLKRLARELQPLAYARRKLELRDGKHAQRVAAAVAAARSLFPSHADLLVAAGANGRTLVAVAQEQRPAAGPRAPTRHLARFFPPARAYPAPPPFAAFLERLGV